MKKNKIFFTTIILGAILAMTSCFDAACVNNHQTSEKIQMSCNEMKLYMKVCYLRTLEKVDSDFGQDPYAAEFRWEIWAYGGIDEDGNDRWELSVSDSHSQMSELQLEQEDGNPAWWDITGLTRIPMKVVLWDKDPWPYHADNYLDINGHYEDGDDRENGRTVEFTYYVENNSFDFEKSGARLSDNHGGCIEFNGKWDIEKEEDKDTIMRIKIWTEEESVNLPPDKPNKPSGPNGGKPGTQYTFSTSTVDPQEDKVMYKFDWGDGSQSNWFGPYESGKTINASHTWNNEGSYKIRVKAKDFPFEEESSWSEPLELSIVKSRTRIFDLFVERILSFF